MSPEQCDADHADLDVRTDVYSLGAVLYELLTGRRPYEASSSNVLRATRTIRDTQPERPSRIRPSLGGDLETILLKALEKDRDRRYPSVAALAADLRRFMNSEPIRARPSTVVYRVRLFARRRRALFAAGLLTSLTVICAAVVCATLWFQAEEDRVQAEASAYSASLAAAQGALAGNDVADANGWLQLAKNSPNSRDGTSWEFLYLQGRVDRSVARCVVSSQPSTGAVVAVAVHPHGKLVASVGPDEVVLWKVAWDGGVPRFDGRVATLPDSAHSGYLGFSASSEWLVVSGHDGVVRFYGETAPGTWAEVERLATRRQGNARIAIAPSGDRVALGLRSGTIQVLDATRLDDIRFQLPLHGHEREVLSLAFDADARLLASASSEATVRIWSMEDGRRTPVAVLAEHADHVNAVAFDPAGGHLLTGSLDGNLGVVDAAQLDRCATRAGEAIQLHAEMHSVGSGIVSLAYSEANRIIAVGCQDNTIRLWSLRWPRLEYGGPKKRRPNEVFRTEELCVLRGHERTVTALAVFPDGRWLLSGSEDGDIRIWSFTPSPDPLVLDAHTTTVDGLAFHPSGKWLVSTARTIAVWDVETGEGDDRSYA